MCSSRVFPIAPCFNPLCFAQSPPFLTYICAPKGRHSIFPQDVLLWGASIVSTFLFVMGQSNSTKKSWTCEGVKLKPKMVMNSFRKRSFMQPLGRLKHTLKVPCIFSFLVGEWGGSQRRNFFSGFPWFPLCSLYDPNKFSSCSQQVPQVLNVFPNMFSIAPLSHMLWQMLSSFHIYRWAKGEELKIKPSILGSFDGFTFF